MIILFNKLSYLFSIFEDPFICSVFYMTLSYVVFEDTNE